MPLTFPLFLSGVALAVIAPALFIALAVAAASSRYRAFAVQVLCIASMSFAMVALIAFIIGSLKDGASVAALQVAVFFGASSFSAVTVLRSFMLWHQRCTSQESLSK